MDRAQIEALMIPGDSYGLDLIRAFRRRPAWHAEAACRGQGPALFFPERGADVRPAKALCSTCPVADQCAAFADGDFDARSHGIWGGLSGRERRAAREGRRAAA